MCLLLCVASILMSALIQIVYNLWSTQWLDTSGGIDDAIAYVNNDFIVMPAKIWNFSKSSCSDTHSPNSWRPRPIRSTGSYLFDNNLAVNRNLGQVRNVALYWHQENSVKGLQTTGGNMNKYIFLAVAMSVYSCLFIQYSFLLLKRTL